MLHPGSNIPDHLRNESVIVYLDSEVLEQVDFIDALPGIPKSLKIFLLAIIDVSRKNLSDFGRVVAGRGQIQGRLLELGYGASNPLVSRRLGDLKNLGVCTVESVAVARRVNIYHIASIQLVLSKTEKNSIRRVLSPTKAVPSKTPKKLTRRTQSIVHAEREVLSRGGGLLLSGHADLILFNQQLFNGILDTAMRISGKDPRRTIEVCYIVNGMPLRITSSCSARADSSLLMMTDQRLMRCIISYCKKTIEHLKIRLCDQYGENFDRRAIPNLFHVDIHELCSLMNMRCENTNFDTIIGMMDRLSDTTFEIDASENPWFMETFSMFSPIMDGDENRIMSDRYKIQFLSNFESARTGSDAARDLFGDRLDGLRPRYYTFSLEHRLFYTLISDNSFNLFLSHDGLSSERSGIIHRFYNWCRAYISGRSKNGIESRWISMTDLHSALTPGHRLDAFRRHFFNALEKFSIGEWLTRQHGRALVYGYYVEYERVNGEDLFRIYRDQNDPIVGNNSRHNVLIRQRQIDLLG